MAVPEKFMSVSADKCRYYAVSAGKCKVVQAQCKISAGKCRQVQVLCKICASECRHCAGVPTLHNYLIINL